MVGCSKTPEVEIRYVDKPVEVFIQVPCKLPKVTCAVDMNATYTEKVKAMGKCIAKYRARDSLLDEENR